MADQAQSAEGMSVSVPHSAQLPFTLSEGKEIIVDGAARHDFSINLCEGPDESHNTALHFNPRFSQNEVVRNHQADGWGQEELDGGFPFVQGTPYKVTIFVKNSCFVIKVNDNIFCEFNHRLPIESVQFLYIKGDTNVENISYNDTNNPVFNNPPVPFTTNIPKGLSKGCKIFISGIPTSNAQRFSVNLLCGDNFEQSDIALHMDNRLNYGAGNTVVRTHKEEGEWGQEETHQTVFPFAPTTPFQITILIEDDEYKIAVNNQQFAEFRHRIPFQKVSHLYVTDDVQLTQVRFQ